jgi:hypothetical protein
MKRMYLKHVLIQRITLADTLTSLPETSPAAVDPREMMKLTLGSRKAGDFGD